MANLGSRCGVGLAAKFQAYGRTDRKSQKKSCEVTYVYVPVLYQLIYEPSDKKFEDKVRGKCRIPDSEIRIRVQHMHSGK